LAPRAFVLIFGRMWACGKFRKRDGGNRRLVGRQCMVDHVVVNDD
jgi:hypothetical protein